MPAIGRTPYRESSRRRSRAPRERAREAHRSAPVSGDQRIGTFDRVGSIGRCVVERLSERVKEEIVRLSAEGLPRRLIGAQIGRHHRRATRIESQPDTRVAGSSRAMTTGLHRRYEQRRNATHDSIRQLCTPNGSDGVTREDRDSRNEARRLVVPLAITSSLRLACLGRRTRRPGTGSRASIPTLSTFLRTRRP